MTRTYSLGEFARLMGVHPKTVQRWDRDGTLTAKRTPTGRRVYTDEDRRRVLGFPEAQKRSIAYCRVSSAAQKPDLKNQRLTKAHKASRTASPRRCTDFWTWHRKLITRAKAK